MSGVDAERTRESLWAHQLVVVQINDLSGLRSRFDSSLPGGGELLYVWVEEDVEEGLVGDPPRDQALFLIE